MWAALWFPAPLRSWVLFDTRPYISFGPFLACPHYLSYYSVIPAVMTQSCWASLGLPFTLSPSTLKWPLVFLLMGSYVPFVFSLGHPWPVCFVLVSSSLLLTLHSHGLLLTSLDFLVPILHSHRLQWPILTFSKSYTAHGYAISLFLGFFKSIYLLNGHLFISWTCDPSFLRLGPDGFVTCLLPLLLGFLPSTWVLKKWPSTLTNHI